MSARRARRQRRQMRRSLGLVPTPRPGASDAVRLGLRLRAEASTTGRCACGAVGTFSEVLPGGAIRPAPDVRRVEDLRPGRAYICDFEHKPDCPAASPELERAVGREEVADPAGDLLAALRSRNEREEKA